MPNNIQNRITIVGSDDQIKEVISSLKGKYEDGTDSSVDFNTIKPMPESLNIESGSSGDMVHNLLFGGSVPKYFPIAVSELQRRFTALSPEQRKDAVTLGLQYQENFEKYGHTTWYNWCVSNWGTKWNAYQTPDQRDSENALYFETAWNSPVELIRLLSEKFQDVEIRLDYADEDSGCNVGGCVFKAGEKLSGGKLENQSKEAYDLYFELHPGSKDDYILVGDSYEYKEE